MEKRKIGSLEVSAVGLGCMGITHASGAPMTTEEGVKVLRPFRDKVAIATKCGVHHGKDRLIVDSRPETIRKSVEGSLKRLGTDYIDLYYQHRIAPQVSPEEVAGILFLRKGRITGAICRNIRQRDLKKAGSF